MFTYQREPGFAVIERGCFYILESRGIMTAFAILSELSLMNIYVTGSTTVKRNTDEILERFTISCFYLMTFYTIGGPVQSC
jgi:hypothetical protein